MPEPATHRSRRLRLEEDFAVFLEALDAWHARRTQADPLGQHRTQLAALVEHLKAGAEALRQGIHQIDLEQSEREVYEQCRLYELRLTWLQRLWDFFRDRFDQRDDPALRDVLRAADEVVWSCHRRVMYSAESQSIPVKPRPAPLAFVEYQSSPDIFPSELIPPELKSVDAEFLRKQLAQLPIPLLRIPATCVHQPWWLVHIGHEMGHHVQYLLVEKAGLVDAFREALEKAVAPAGGDAAVDRWGRWSVEVFADVFSVHAMGAPAVTAMLELELQRHMGSRPGRYPSAAVRLALLAKLADRLGLPGQDALRGLKPAELVAQDAVAKQDLALVEAVVETALAPLPGLDVRLSRLCTVAPVEQDELEGWVPALLGRDTRGSSQALDAARQVASAAFLAWREEAADAQKAVRVELARKAVGLLKDSGPRESRAPPPSSTPGAAKGLADELMSMTRVQLEQLTGG